MVPIEDLKHLNFPHTQIIRFDNGESRPIRNVVAVEKGAWVHIFTEDDGHGKSEYIINPDRVLFISVKSN